MLGEKEKEVINQMMKNREALQNIVEYYEKAYPGFPSEQVRDKFLEVVQRAKPAELKVLLKPPYSIFLRVGWKRGPIEQYWSDK